MTNNVEKIGARERSPAIDLHLVARISLPVHALLPWVLWGLAWIDPSISFAIFIALHALFPILLLLSYRWWRGQGTDLALLVTFNHLATFASGAIASGLAQGLH